MSLLEERHLMSSDKAIPKPDLRNTPETQFESILIQLKIPYERQYQFFPKRKWAFDFAIPEKKLAFEIDGGLYKKKKYKDRQGNIKIHEGGRHLDPIGFMGDCKKCLHAQLKGWTVVRIPAPWLKHYWNHKPAAHLINYQDLKEIVKYLYDQPVTDFLA